MFFFQKKWLFSGYFRQSENGFLVVILERLTGFSTLKKVGNPELSCLFLVRLKFEFCLILSKPKMLELH